MERTSAHFLDSACTALEELRASAPLVQCLTNAVVTNFTANALLALGASAAMADLPGEAGPFARIASGVLINLGTPASEQREGMLEAAAAADDAATPWVLDPVAVGSLPVRTELAQRLLDQRPTIIRGNASEVIALGGLGAGGRGVDSSDSVDSALPAAMGLARRTGGVVAVSGPVDLVTDGTRAVRIANGHSRLTQITGGGCALGAVMAAFAGLDGSRDSLESMVAAVLVYTVAAEIAAERSEGPGSFAVAFLDALAAVTAEDLRSRAAMTLESHPQTDDALADGTSGETR